jgi:hypothetical protein
MSSTTSAHSNSKTDNPPSGAMNLGLGLMPIAIGIANKRAMRIKDAPKQEPILQH